MDNKSDFKKMTYVISHASGTYIYTTTILGFPVPFFTTMTRLERATTCLHVPEPPGPYIHFVLVPTACSPNITQPIQLEIPIRHAVLCCHVPIKWFRYVAWCVLKLEGSIWISRGFSIADRSDHRCEDSDTLVKDVYYQFKPDTSCEWTFARATISS